MKYLHQVSAGSNDIRLSEAPDGSVITARPVDRVLVRARVGAGPATSASTNASAPHPTSTLATLDWSQVVPLSLRSTWPKAVETLANELCVPVGRGRGAVNVRRLARSAAAAAVSDRNGTDAGTTHVSPDDEARPTSVGSLLNGDTLVLSVEEEAFAASAAGATKGMRVCAGAIGAGGSRFNNSAVVSKRKLGGTQNSGTCTREPPASRSTAPSEINKSGAGETPTAGDRASANDEAVEEAIDRLMIAAPARILQPSSVGTSVGAGAAANVRVSSSAGPWTTTAPSPHGRLPYYQNTNAEIADADGHSYGKVHRSNLAPRHIPTPIGRSPFSNGPSSGDGSATVSPPPPLHALRSTLPVFSPHTKGVSCLGAGLKRPPYISPAAGLGPSSISTHPRQQPSLSTSREINTECSKTWTGAGVSAADEEAIAELVGMGFDRDHVVGALKQGGRGESWKEAAISLLLEPQMSADFEALGEDGGKEGLKRHKGPTTVQG